ncbi:hypothetical protein F4780DRAFT_315145 [Xylariomycetidae sp. FL0641]|nr:hypothetical protein F4780DRAFT_315145 [Xylariomycetidae sp. FL0641]
MWLMDHYGRAPADARSEACDQAVEDLQCYFEKVYTRDYAGFKGQQTWKTVSDAVLGTTFWRTAEEEKMSWKTFDFPFFSFFFPFFFFFFFLSFSFLLSFPQKKKRKRKKKKKGQGTIDAGSHRSCTQLDSATHRILCVFSLLNQHPPARKAKTAFTTGCLLACGPRPQRSDATASSVPSVS